MSTKSFSPTALLLGTIQPKSNVELSITADFDTEDETTPIIFIDVEKGGESLLETDSINLSMPQIIVLSNFLNGIIKGYESMR